MCQALDDRCALFGDFCPSVLSLAHPAIPMDNRNQMTFPILRFEATRIHQQFCPAAISSARDARRKSSAASTQKLQSAFENVPCDTTLDLGLIFSPMI
jgi:hypothetical protein